MNTIKSYASLLIDTVWARLIFAALAGALSAFAMAPGNHWYTLITGLGLLFILQKRAKKPYHAFWIGWAFGFSYFLISLNWIGNALLVEGNDFIWAYSLAVSGLPCLLAFFTAIACYFSRKLTSNNVIHSLISFIMLLGTMEVLRGYVFTGFPWNLYGYAWGGQIEILQILSVMNVYGLTFITISWGALAGVTFSPGVSIKMRLISALIFMATFGALHIYGADRLKNAPPMLAENNLTIRLIQPNIQQADKWKRDKMLQNYEHLLALSANNDAQSDLRKEKLSPQTTWIVWPETAISYHHIGTEHMHDMLRNMLRTYKDNVYLITGILLKNQNDNSYSNSIVIIDKNAEIIARYDKSHLVPFGEYIPFQQWIPLQTVTQFSGFRAGKGRQTLVMPDDKKIGPLVCYEILFPGQVVEVQNKPDYIVNVTNDAWYGHSAGPEQHLMKARYRAIEENTPVIRVANTGYSAIIDGFGRYVVKTNLFETNIKEFK